MKTPEFKKMIGERKKNSDGFTYEYGCAKGGYKSRARHKNAIKRGKRKDKRSVKAKELKRMLAEG
jgi:hypothetical protein